MADLVAILNRLTALEADLLACQTEMEPSPPTSCVAALDGPQTSASISFGIPASGGSPITSYEAISTPGGFTTSGATSPLVVTGLDGANVEYTFEVRAANAVGHSLPCVTAAVGTNPLAMALQACQNAAQKASLCLFGGQIGYSLDGRDFLVSLGRIGVMGAGGAVASNGSGMYVATGGTVVAYGNGITMSNATIPTMSAVSAVAYGNGTWLIGGPSATASDPTIRYSTDNALTWNLATMPASMANENVSTIAFDGVGRWIAGTRSGGQIPYTSIDDGVTWTSLSSLVFTSGAGVGNAGAIAHDGAGTWVAFSAWKSASAPFEFEVAHSTDDGATWTLTPFTAGPITFPNRIAYDPTTGRWVVVCQVQFAGAHQNIFWSDDITTWNSIGAIVSGSGQVVDVMHNGIDQWTVVINSVNLAIAYSADGTTWTTVAGPGNNQGSAICSSRLLP